MNKILEKNINSVLELDTGEKLAIIPDLKNPNVCLLDKNNNVLRTLSSDEAKTSLSFTYSYNNKCADAIFWLNGKTLNVENVNVSKFLDFINWLKTLIYNKTDVEYLDYMD